MDYGQEKEIIRQHKLWIKTNGKEGKYGTFKDKSYSFIEFSNENLEHLNFNTCTFKNCIFTKLTLASAHFFHCNFESCMISDSNCLEIDMNNCHFKNVTFKNMMFFNGYVRSGSLLKTNFSNCIIRNLSFINNKFDDYTKSVIYRLQNEKRTYSITFSRQMLCLIRMLSNINGLDKREEDELNETDLYD